MSNETKVQLSIYLTRQTLLISLLSKEIAMSVEPQHDCDKADNKIIEDVNTYGWSVVMIEAIAYLPSFAYTIGLWKTYSHPEIIAFGLTVKTLHLVLNDLGDAIKKGKPYEPNVNYSDIFENSDVKLIPVDRRNIKDYFGYAIWFNKNAEFPAMQLVWTDRNNKFPWEENYQEEFLYRQPLLDRNARFKFREAKNLGIFTTRQWLEENKPILRVVHDEDGDWQFLTGDQMPSDMKIVALEQMVLKDNSLNDIFNLDYGKAADRTKIGGEWKRSTLPSEED